MENLRKGSHSVHQLHIHVVWSTKYRYPVLRGDIQVRCRDLIRQICDAMDVRILKGVVSKDHVHVLAFRCIAKNTFVKMSFSLISPNR